ncbi:hypothetical protein CKO11_11010 [Rhodobacter sp. TJ_12]|uniref:DUF2798 domain-containing protein n=1 Tax=Rhodobacter sp. TJ_12 TaxID=2029399 RepID=UPI001CBDBA5E|nr:DUF2798 domain-containing protein [Rhodobacter sp. TJ_12]MBZ4022988.1 hypothetical protein [Rhodobacter sp. TJ_12]
MEKPNPKREKLTIIVAQVFISCLMALLMTFFFAVLPEALRTDFAPGWGWIWLRDWLTAWPVAFVLSLGVGPLAFKLAFWLLHPRRITE